jgi:septum formation protein
MQLILASTSPYRKQLLERLRVPFQVLAPGVEETILPGETPAAMAERLALEKARAVAQRHPDAWVIGSDQVAHCGAAMFGKPGTREGAIAQLTQLSDQTVVFDTALSLVHEGRQRETVVRVPTEVVFRPLGRDAIERYVDLEQPFDCAGAAKSEGLGISLLRAIRGDDPTALVGLPLIALAELLRQAGFDLP